MLEQNIVLVTICRRGTFLTSSLLKQTNDGEKQSANFLNSLVFQIKVVRTVHRHLHLRFLDPQLLIFSPTKRPQFIFFKNQLFIINFI